ncbi:hypothetical protein D3C77_663240 [compost metagenome]
MDMSIDETGGNDCIRVMYWRQSVRQACAHLCRRSEINNLSVLDQHDVVRNVYQTFFRILEEWVALECDNVGA